MCCLGFIKRVAPFALTFALGLFIASFFVTLPSFKFPKRENRWQKNHQMRMEVERLKERNAYLERRNAELERSNYRVAPSFETLDVPPPPMPPMPPKAPIAPNYTR